MSSALISDYVDGLHRRLPAAIGRRSVLVGCVMSKTILHAVALLLAALVTAGEFAAAAAIARGQYAHAERMVLASNAPSAERIRSGILG